MITMQNWRIENPTWNTQPSQKWCTPGFSQTVTVTWIQREKYFIIMRLDLGLASAYKLFCTVGDGYCRLCRFVQLSVITAHWKWTFSAHCLPSCICFCLILFRPLHSSTDDSISPVTQWVYIHEVIPNHWTHLLLILGAEPLSHSFVGLHDQSGAGSSCREDED